jgi:hypothetical protein
MSAVRRATSRKAREVAHPQFFRSTSKDKPALYFPVIVAHPPNPEVLSTSTGHAMVRQNCECMLSSLS